MAANLWLCKVNEVVHRLCLASALDTARVMGLDNTAAQTLCGAKSAGADFGSTLMIGRQWLLAAPELVAKVARLHAAAARPSENHAFAEPFFEMLGAKRVDSLDFSTFEGATVQHDLNLPIPPRLHGQYDLVFDGGSLEHVFNFPQALKNCMEMVRPGGHFVQVSNANNFMGHGFWQISPELMYRAMSPANGFETVAVMLRELHQGGRNSDLKGKFHTARDPDALGWRVELTNRRPTYIITIAQRTGDGPIFAEAPQQSDYQRLWDTGDGAIAPVRTGLKTRAIAAIRKIVPAHVERAIRRPFANKAYLALSHEDVMHGRFGPRQA